MNRIHRLHRSAFFCGAVLVALLLLTIPASRDFVSGEPAFLVSLLAMMLPFGGAAMFFMWVADRVEAAAEG